MDPLISLLLTFLFLLLTLIGVLGNLIVIIAIAGDRKMRSSVMNVLLLNLAIADLSNVVLASSEWVPQVIFEKKWMLPAILCPICRYLECVSLYASISTQLIVCIERYIAIVLPMKARQLSSRMNAILAVLMAWLFTGIFALPLAFGNIVKMNKFGEYGCTNIFGREPWWTDFKWAEFMLFYCIPCVVIIGVYSKVATVLWAQNPQLHEASCLTSPHNAQTENLRMRRSVVNMLIACTAVYFICYSPIQILFLSKNVFNLSLHPPHSFALLMNALALTCSASNPLLYTLFSTKFRRRLKGVLASFCAFVRIRRLSTCNGIETPHKTVYSKMIVSKDLSSDQH